MNRLTVPIYNWVEKGTLNVFVFLKNTPELEQSALQDTKAVTRRYSPSLTTPILVWCDGYLERQVEIQD